MSDLTIGEASFGDNSEKNFKKTNNWRIDTEGSHIYRIMPPIGLLASSGKWSYYDAVHWGFTASNGKMRPFRCIQRKKNGKIETHCPACDKIAEMQHKKATIEAQLKEQEKNPQEIAKAVEMYTDWLKRFNVEKAHYLNVMRPDGQMGKLKVKINHKKALDSTIKKLLDDEGINPIDPKQGVWIDFQRTGTGFNDTQYTTDVVYDTVIGPNGKKMKSIKDAPLTDEELVRYAKEGSDLLVQFKEITAEQIRLLVESDANPEVVDSVFGAPKIQKMNNKPTAPVLDMSPSEEEEDAVPPPPSVEEPEEDGLAVLRAQLAAAELKAAQKKAQAQPKPVAAPITPKNEVDDSTADFIRKFNEGKLA